MSQEVERLPGTVRGAGQFLGAGVYGAGPYRVSVFVAFFSR